MIFLECDSVNAVDELLKKIRIKETQLNIAQKSGMSYVAQALTEQLVELRAQLSDAPDPEFQSLMSLLDN